MFNFFKPHIVQFRDGKYAIRKRTLLGYRYKDLTHVSFWWNYKEYREGTKKSETLMHVENLLEALSDRGTIIETKE